MHDNLGALVGWTSQDLGDRVALKLETVTKAGPRNIDDVDTHFFIIDKLQAVQLGSYLFRIAGQTEPRLAERSLMGRIFAR